MSREVLEFASSALAALMRVTHVRRRDVDGRGISNALHRARWEWYGVSSPSYLPCHNPRGAATECRTYLSTRAEDVIPDVLRAARGTHHAYSLAPRTPLSSTQE